MKRRTLEEIAYYLGHVTKKRMLAIQTTVRYTQISREQVKEEAQEDQKIKEYVI
jgi:hypothetical protein